MPTRPNVKKTVKQTKPQTHQRNNQAVKRRERVEKINTLLLDIAKKADPHLHTLNFQN